MALRNNSLVNSRKETHHMFRPLSSILLAAGVVVLSATQTVAEQMCKPGLSVTDVRFSDAMNQHRKWSAALNVDASRCAVVSGGFEINFVRIKEMAPDLPFTERFTWTAGKAEVGLDFWWDEAVLEYSIGTVEPCTCRDPRQAQTN